MSGATVSIGKYRNETDWSQFDDNLAKARRREGLVHQVDYINGDNCDVTGKPRQAVAKVGGAVREEPMWAGHLGGAKVGGLVCVLATHLQHMGVHVVLMQLCESHCMRCGVLMRKART